MREIEDLRYKSNFLVFDVDFFKFNPWSADIYDARAIGFYEFFIFALGFCVEQVALVEIKMNEFVDLASYIFDLPESVVATFLVVSFAVLKMKGYVEGRFKVRRETLQEIINMFSRGPIENENFILEQLFFNHYGVILTGGEIKFFLKERRPSFLLKLYLSAREYVEFDEGGGFFKKKVSGSLRRKEYGCLAAYFFFAFSAMVLLLTAPSVFSESGPDVYVVWSVLVVSFVVLAGVLMDSATNASSAVKLLNILQKDRDCGQLKNNR
ncbi:hypothetical protein LL252_17750 [Alcanivorax marinus]|uniref:Uncharacterized protein n=1 Tax=Alloalcanivorax marinus TaxID=1177169 RepID=A0A9Q3UQ88_9GAMM|nr:hypothetical protein [Alloalcanivorax marinus]MCC4310415.1 hypothetical protein [Alloalcanivorax marinus]